MPRAPQASSERIGIAVSVLIPAQDEAENLTELIPEVLKALNGEELEIIVIDDASRDDTAEVVKILKRSYPQIRLIRNQPPAGKSGALWVGAFAAYGKFGITVDGDGQNDPKYLKPMLASLRAGDDIGLVAGQRQRRGDSTIRLIASRIANGVRGRLLGDDTRDTACGLKAFRMTAFRNLPQFESLHRFLPALIAADGWRVEHLDVVDRPRRFGRSKYGIWDRLALGIPDLFGVWWLACRRRRLARVTTAEID